MSAFKRVALITLDNGAGGLDSVIANSIDEQDIKRALLTMVNNGIFQVGDSIHIEEIETEIE